jgi:exosortase A-associated hydrolase 2
MNRSRRMVALQARQLVETGVRVIVFDLFGTGDSEGDFGDARWERWLEDVSTIASWARGERSSLLAIRLGALLALEAAAEGGFHSAVLWHPCVSGNTYLRQFLRLRMAEKLINERPDAESVSALLARFTQGEAVEVAGYELAAPLALAIQARSFGDLTPQRISALHWFDVVAADGDPLSAATAATVERWAAAGVGVEAAAVRGEPFWSVQEITVAPLLLEATTRALVEG